MEGRLFVGCLVLCWIFICGIHEGESYCQQHLNEKPAMGICQEMFQQGAVGQTLYIDADEAPTHTAITCKCELRFDDTTTIHVVYRSEGLSDAVCGIQFEVDNNVFGCKRQESVKFISSKKNDLNYVKVSEDIENIPGCIGIKPEFGSMNITCFPSQQYVPTTTVSANRPSTISTTTATTPTTTQTTTTTATTTAPTTTITTPTTTKATTTAPTTTTTTTPTTTPTSTTTLLPTTPNPTTTPQPTTTPKATITTEAPTTGTSNPTTRPTTRTPTSSPPTTAPATTRTTTGSSTPSTEEPVIGAQQDEESNTAALAGGIVGALAGVILIVVIVVILVCFIGRRRKKKKNQNVNGHRSLRYFSSGDDVTITENELYDGGTPSHTTNALFVGGIPEHPGTSDTIPHFFAPGTGDRYAVIIDSTKSKPKKERPKLRTFRGPSVDDDVKGAEDDTETDKKFSRNNYNDVDFATDNPGYDPDYLVPHSPMAASETGSPYDYIDPGKLDYDNVGSAGNTSDADAANNGGYTRFINQDSVTDEFPYANTDNGVDYITKDGGDYANVE